MPNVRISDLPRVTLPMDQSGTFFEVETTEGGEVVSRSVSGDQLTFNVSGTIQGLGPWVYNINVAPPVAGEVTFDNADPSLATVVSVADVNGSGSNVGGILNLLGSGSLMYVQDQNNNDNLITIEVGTPTDQGSYVDYPITQSVAQGGAFDDLENVLILVTAGGGGLPAGALGETIVITTAPDTYEALSTITVGAAAIAAPSELVLDVGTIVPNMVFIRGATATGQGFFQMSEQGTGFGAGLLFQQLGDATTIIQAADGSLAGDAGRIRIDVHDGTQARTGLAITGIPADDPDGVNVKLQFPGAATSEFALFQSFFRFSGQTTTANSIFVVGANGNGVDVRLRDSTLGGGMLSLEAAGTLALVQLAGDGTTVEDTWITMARNAGVARYFNDVQKDVTTVDGVLITGALLEIDNSGVTDETGWRFYNSTGGWKMHENTVGQNFFYQTDNAGGQEDLMWVITRNGNWQFFRNNLAHMTFSNAGTQFGDLTTAHSITVYGASTGSNGGRLTLSSAAVGEDLTIATVGAAKNFTLGSQGRMILTDDAGVTLNWSNTAIGADLNATGWKVDGTVLDLNNSSNATDAFIRARNSSGGLTVEVDGATALVTFHQTSGTGTIQGSWVDFTRSGGVTGYFNNNINWLGVSAGMDIRSSVGNLPALTLQDNAGVDHVELLGNAGSPILRGRVDSGTLTIAARNSSSAFVNLFVGDPDLGGQTMYQGTIVTETKSYGLDVRHPTASAPIIMLMTNTGTILANLQVSGTTLEFRNRQDAGHVLLEADATGGTTRSLFRGDPDADAKLYQVGVEVARTLTAANGGFEVNNTSTGAGFERVLTVGDLAALSFVSREILDAQETATSDVTLGDVTGFTTSLLASTRYKFRIVLWVSSNTAGTTPGLRLRADYSGTFGVNTGRILEWRDSGLVASARALTDNTITGLNCGTTSDENMVVYEGTIETITSGTLKLQMAQNISDADATVIEENSTWEVWTD